MGEFVWLATALGALVGMIHATQIYRQRRSDEGASPARALYFAIWAIGLWTLFGTYLLAFWIIGAIGLAVSRLSSGLETG